MISGEARRPLGVHRVLAIASGKGGVGKSTVTVNLALALRRLGLAVGVFDADVYGPNVNVLIGEPGDPRRAPLCAGDLRMIPIGRRNDEPYIVPKRKFGIEFLSFGFWFRDSEAVEDQGETVGHMVRQTILDTRWPALDVLLIDMPPGTGEPQQTMMKTLKIDAVVLVDTGHSLSVADVRRAATLFESHEIPVLGSVTNMTYAVCPRCGERVQLFDVADQQTRGSVEALGELPLDPALGRPLDPRHPLTEKNPSGPIADALLEAAGRVAERITGA